MRQTQRVTLPETSYASRRHATKLYHPLFFDSSVSILGRDGRFRGAPVHALERRRRAVGRVSCRQQVEEPMLVAVPHAVRQDDGAVVS